MLDRVNIYFTKKYKRHHFRKPHPLSHAVEFEEGGQIKSRIVDDEEEEERDGVVQI